MGHILCYNEKQGCYIDEFEERFAQLCNAYGENYDFDDGQDLD